jgi:hypothetical protein
LWRPARDSAAFHEAPVAAFGFRRLSQVLRYDNLGGALVNVLKGCRRLETA